MLLAKTTTVEQNVHVKRCLYVLHNLYVCVSLFMFSFLPGITICRDFLPPLPLFSSLHDSALRIKICPDLVLPHPCFPSYDVLSVSSQLAHTPLLILCSPAPSSHVRIIGSSSFAKYVIFETSVISRVS